MIWNDSLAIGVQEGVQDKSARNIKPGVRPEPVAPGDEPGARRTHFAAEEIMQQNGYPDIAAHKKEHAALTGKLLEF